MVRQKKVSVCERGGRERAREKRKRETESESLCSNDFDRRAGTLYSIMYAIFFRHSFLYALQPSKIVWSEEKKQALNMTTIKIEKEIATRATQIDSALAPLHVSPTHTQTSLTRKDISNFLHYTPHAEVTGDTENACSCNRPFNAMYRLFSHSDTIAIFHKIHPRPTKWLCYL